MRRIALFGGSFNPIHFGHLAVAEAALRRDLCDEVWLIVSPHNPLKLQAGLLDERERLALARLAVRNIPHVVVSDVEFHLPRPSYTWRTLTTLRKSMPSARFLLIIGSDNWQVFSHWAHHDDLLATTSLIIYPRPGYPVQATTLPPQVTLLDVPQFDISSTKIRQLLKAGADITPYVPETVAQAIAYRHLYAT